MTLDREVEYNLMREAEERHAAAASGDAAVRDAHAVMAERYADRAWSLTETILSRPMER